MSKLSFLLTAALAATASAQIAVPAIFADAEGGTSGNIWRAGTNRVQCVYSGNDFDSRESATPSRSTTSNGASQAAYSAPQ